MKKTFTELPEIKLVGITCRTSNASEMNPLTAKIGQMIQKYQDEGIASKIPNLKNPVATYCVYTEYENDFNGEYTYFIGAEVSSFDEVPSDLCKLTIKNQRYAKFTNGPAPMPGVCIDMWQSIWAMNSEELGGKRKYSADFEVYDERAYDLNNATLDIYIALE
ncbi:MAG: putative transcription activator [Candidatus Midichloriaceae bacterium]|jgi:predicted transcriptional regulator YdeE|nr:putative transcription activator [Candidatus Midichloriaceae bacterium]